MDILRCQKKIGRIKSVGSYGGVDFWLRAKCVSSVLGPHLLLLLSACSWSLSLGVRDVK